MALTPEDIETHTFKVSRRGYDKVEVDRFLGQVATSYRDLQRSAADASGSIVLDTDPATAPLPRRVPGATTAADDPTADASSPATGRGGQLFALDDSGAVGDDFNRLGSEVANVLRTAHHSVATLRHEAEVEAAMIRQRAEREIADLRQEADNYATRVKAEADVYATDRATEANFSHREAERVLAEAQAKADANLADTERRIISITEQAEAVAAARTTEIMADANRRLEEARGTEQALREQLIAAHGDLAAALSRFPAETDATVDLTDEAMAAGDPLLDLTGDETGTAEPPVPPGWPGGGERVGRPDKLFGDERGGSATALATVERDLSSDAAPTTSTDTIATESRADGVPQVDDDRHSDGGPLADIMKDAIGKAVQSAMSRRDDLEG